MLLRVEYIAVPFAQTNVEPLTTGVGFALIVTEYAAVVTTHELDVIVSATIAVPVPALPHVMFTLLVFCPDVMVPPVTVQT